MNAETELQDANTIAENKMEISQALRNDILFITLIGQLWQKEELTELEETIKNCIQEKQKTVVLDLQRLSFINSQGLGLLVRFHTCMSNAGGRLILSSNPSSVLEVLEISGFNEFMTIAKSEKELQNFIASS